MQPRLRGQGGYRRAAEVLCWQGRQRPEGEPRACLSASCAPLRQVRFPSRLDVQEFETAIAATGPLDSRAHAFQFDYTDVSFAPLSSHVHALSLYNQLVQQGATVELVWPDGSTISYAERMGFFQVLDPRVEVSPTRPAGGLAEIFRASNPTLLELTQIHPGDRAKADQILRLVYDRVASNLAGCQDSETVAGRVATVATEVVENIFQWSDTKLPGIIGLQRYPKGGQFGLTIGDSGMGITASLRANQPRLVEGLADHEIILRAFRDGLSSRSEAGGGAGLTRCAQIAAQYKGRLLVRTNRTWSKLIVKAKRGGANWNISETNAARIDGTIITFELLLDRLGATTA
jgi:hypothetical protein